ncbi:nuclear transport factor 2 family protein [Kribbella sp. NPDC050124]|uniref:nuclear transport factor 2 family protein n=1 Tax=Kribbella sp. NPDC050124 TaxID=3364114 RepID=UPI00378A773B
MNMKLSLLAIPTALATTIGAAVFAVQGPHNGVEATTKQKTYALLDALERQDMPAIRSLMASSVTWSNPMALTGDNDNDATRHVGEDAVIGYFSGELQDLIKTVDFVDERVTVDGRTSMVEARGDFVTATGRPYRNVYVFRFDWRDGELVAGVEYLNPMTICWSFELPLCTPPA